MTDKTIQLSDDRTLGYAEYGLPTGKPVMYFHPHPGSRVSATFLADIAAQHSIRIIAPDRPGCGLSDIQTERSLLDWPQDVLELADNLRITHFGVLGASGGGPYAAVCAHELPERVTKTGLLASVGPLDVAGSTAGMINSTRLMFGVAKYLPGLIPYMLSGMADAARERPDSLVEQTRSAIPSVDVLAMDDGDHWGWFTMDLKEAFRSGVKGPARDVILYAHSWGFQLEDIQVPVFLRHGELDTNAPPSMGQHMAKSIPDCDVKILPGLAHLSVILSIAEEALLWLCG